MSSDIAAREKPRVVFPPRCVCISGISASRKNDAASSLICLTNASCLVLPLFSQGSSTLYPKSLQSKMRSMSSEKRSMRPKPFTGSAKRLPETPPRWRAWAPHAHPTSRRRRRPPRAPCQHQGKQAANDRTCDFSHCFSNLLRFDEKCDESLVYYEVM